MLPTAGPVEPHGGRHFQKQAALISRHKWRLHGGPRSIRGAMPLCHRQQGIAKEASLHEDAGVPKQKARARATARVPAAGAKRAGAVKFGRRAASWYPPQRIAIAEGESSPRSLASNRRNRSQQRGTGGTRVTQGSVPAAEGEARAGQNWRAAPYSLCDLGSLLAGGDCHGPKPAQVARGEPQRARRCRSILATSLQKASTELAKLSEQKTEEEEDEMAVETANAWDALANARRQEQQAQQQQLMISLQQATETAASMANAAQDNSRTPRRAKRPPPEGSSPELARPGEARGHAVRTFWQAIFQLGLWGCLSEHHRPAVTAGGQWILPALAVSDEPDFVSVGMARVLGLSLELSTRLDAANVGLAEHWYDPRCDDIQYEEDDVRQSSGVSSEGGFEGDGCPCHTELMDSLPVETRVVTTATESPSDSFRGVQEVLISVKQALYRTAVYSSAILHVLDLDRP